METDTLAAVIATAVLFIFMVCSIGKAYIQQTKEDDATTTHATDADAFKAPSF